MSIFDEVMTGCRLARGGMQERAGVRPDMTCLGKIVGGGMPLAVYGGKRAIMENRAAGAGLPGRNPERESGRGQRRARDPRAAGRRALRAPREAGRAAGAGAGRGHRGAQVTACVQRVGSMIPCSSAGPVRSWDDAKACDTKAFGRWHGAIIERGFYWPPAQFEAAFISGAHTEEDIDATVKAAEESLGA